MGEGEEREDDVGEADAANRVIAVRPAMVYWRGRQAEETGEPPSVRWKHQHGIYIAALLQTVTQAMNQCYAIVVTTPLLSPPLEVVGVFTLVIA